MMNPGDVRRLGRSEFEALSRLVQERSGICLRDGKEELVMARLTKRLRELELDGFDSYLKLVASDPSEAELRRMLDLLTTNKTSFFREPRHFDFLRERLLPSARGKRLRIWSAACSTGEEPYTIAMTLLDAVPDLAAWDARILATDLSLRALEKARAGVYSEEAVREAPRAVAARRFAPCGTEAPRRLRVCGEVRRLVSFARLNLLEPWPMKGPFDAVFCRNAMIYFDKPTQEALVRRFHALLRPGGFLFVGHSESLAGLRQDLRYVQPAVYVREGA